MEGTAKNWQSLGKLWQGVAHPLRGRLPTLSPATTRARPQETAMSKIPHEPHGTGTFPRVSSYFLILTADVPDPWTE
jgi:hypothetical protein